MAEKEERKGWRRELGDDRDAEDVIVDGISDILMLIDARSYDILEVNEAFVQAYGLSREDAVGRKCYAVSHRLDRPCHTTDEACPCPVAGASDSGGPTQVEHVHFDSEGKEVYVETIGYPVRNDEGEVVKVIHLSRDVSERKRLESELREKEKLQGILELAGAASHEINQPLTVVLLGLRQLVKSLEGRPTDRKLAELALADAERLHDVSLRLRKITCYATTDYVSGDRILDLSKASAEDVEGGC